MHSIKNFRNFFIAINLQISDLIRKKRLSGRFFTADAATSVTGIPLAVGPNHRLVGHVLRAI
ncbi:hypothetical protein [Paraburkholderia xenovorans]